MSVFSMHARRSCAKGSQPLPIDDLSETPGMETVRVLIDARLAGQYRVCCSLTRLDRQHRDAIARIGWHSRRQMLREQEQAVSIARTRSIIGVLLSGSTVTTSD